MEIRKYTELKQRGALQLIKHGHAAVLIARRFDPESGEEIEPHMQAVSVDEVDRLIAELQEQLENAQALRADLVALGMPRSGGSQHGA